MVVVESEEENEYVEKLMLEKDRNRAYWLGLARTEKKGEKSGTISFSDRSPKGNMWSAIPVALLCIIVNLCEG